MFSSEGSVKQQLFDAIERNDAQAMERAIDRAMEVQWSLDSMRQGGRFVSHSLMRSKALTPDLMQKMFESGVDPQRRDADGNSLWHYLMQNPAVNVPLAQGLLAKIPSVNPGNFLVETPLTHLLRNPAVTPDVVEFLLQHNARLSIPKRATPMSHGLAANEGITPEVLRVFLNALQKRKDAAKQLNCDTDKGAALHYLLRNPSATPELMEMLIEAGADVNQKSRHYFKAGIPLGNWAMAPYKQPVQRELLQVLLNHGATWGDNYWQAQRLMSSALVGPTPDPKLALQLMEVGRLMASDDRKRPIPERVLDNPQMYRFFVSQLGKETNHFIKAMLKAEVAPQLEQLLAGVYALEAYEARLALRQGRVPERFRKFSPDKASQKIAQDAFAIFPPGRHALKAAGHEVNASKKPTASSVSDDLNYFKDCNLWFHSTPIG